MGPTNSAKLPDELAHMPLCAFCKRSGWEELRPGVRWRYCEHRRAGVAFDGSRWEGHGPMTEAEFGVVLEVMDDAEEQIIEYIITQRSGKMRDVLDNMADGGRDLVLSEEDLPGVSANYDPAERINSKADITFDRVSVQQHANNLDPNDDVVAERRLYAKVFAETVIHEMCHDFRHPEEGHPTDDGGAYESSQVWWDTDFGECIRVSYSSVFGESAPTYRSAAGLSVDSDFDTAPGMQTIFDNQQDFFKSTRSGTGAVDQIPSADLDWVEGQMP